MVLIENSCCTLKLGGRSVWTLALVALCGGLGCDSAYHWDAGTWVEGDFEVDSSSTVCAWSDLITDPEVPYSYTLSAVESNSGLSLVVTSGSESQSLTEHLEELQDSADDLWNVCVRRQYEMNCDSAIQLTQHDVDLVERIEEVLPSECIDGTVEAHHSTTSGLLVSEGEVFMNHELRISCSVPSVLPDTNSTQTDCALRYASTLELQ